MGRTKAQQAFFEPANMMVDAAIACITHVAGTDRQSECAWPVIHRSKTGHGGMNTEAMFFRIFLVVFIGVQMPIVIIGLVYLIFSHSDTEQIDEELKKLCHGKQAEIDDWAECREKRLFGASLWSMIRYDLGFKSELDDAAHQRALMAKYDEQQELLKLYCPQCTGTGKYVCKSDCNECNGTGWKEVDGISTKQCRIEDTPNDQGKVPCPDNHYKVCPHCGLKFCAYHYFVNKNQEFGSFGGHVCQQADDKVESRSKNLCHALGAFFGHALGLW
jgi:hypothetical protein